MPQCLLALGLAYIHRKLFLCLVVVEYVYYGHISIFFKRWNNKGLQEFQQVISPGDTNVMFSAFLTFTQLLRCYMKVILIGFCLLYQIE